MTLASASGLVATMLGGTLGAAGRRIDDPWRLRRRWRWWGDRPDPITIVRALRTLAGGRWRKIEDALEDEPPGADRIESLARLLRSDDWTERLRAKVLLSRARGGPIEVLDEGLAPHGTRARHDALHVIRTLAEESERILAGSPDRHLCPACLSHPVRHEAPASGIDYWGCRVCGRSRDLLDVGAGVELVVDSDPDADRDAELGERDGYLTVGWFQRRAPVDFDRVRIERASDREIEELAIELGNDPEAGRRRYDRMTCTIAPGASVSENTRRILERTFGEVVDLPPSAIPMEQAPERG